MTKEYTKPEAITLKMKTGEGACSVGSSAGTDCDDGIMANHCDIAGSSVMI